MALTRPPLVFLLLVLACDRPGTPDQASPPKPATSPAGPQLGGLRQLALQTPPGQGPIEARILELQELVRRQPDKHDAWILLGRTWIQKARQAADPGFYANADACADVALELRPEHPLGLDLRALVLMNAHRFADARELARRALAKDPDDLMALGNLSDALLELGDFAAAKEVTQQMINLRPGLPSYSRAAHLRFLAGDNVGAKQLYRLAMDAGQGSKDTEPLAWVTVEAAKIFLVEGNLEAAEAGFLRALDTFRDHPAALAGLARVRLAQGRFEESAELAGRSFLLSALAETAWLHGDALTQAGRVDEAKLAYAKVKRLGEHGEGRVWAAFLAARDEAPEQALSTAQAELQIRGEPYTHDAHAWALYRTGALQEAKAAIERATTHGTRDPLLLFHQGAIRLAVGDRGGCELLREARRLGLHFPIAAALELSRLSARCAPSASAG
jgi:tetratricopeptide (TPR) repeat protein